MCVDPVTAMAIASTVISVASTGAQTFTDFQTGRANANIAENNAMIERNAAALDASRFQKRLAAEIGAMTARQGESGFSSTDGAALEARVAAAGEGAIDAELIRVGGEQRAQNFEQQARMHRFSANMSVLNGTLGAAGDLLSLGTQWPGLQGAGAGGGSSALSSSAGSARSGYGPI